jgi:hypothetical protein
MKKITITISLLGILIGLSSCGGYQGPQFFQGNYYWVDSDCDYFDYRTATSIECRNSDKVSTGYRNAMTDQELDMYYHRQHMRQLQNNSNQRRRGRAMEWAERYNRKQSEKLLK